MGRKKSAVLSCLRSLYGKLCSSYCVVVRVENLLQSGVAKECALETTTYRRGLSLIETSDNVWEEKDCWGRGSGDDGDGSS